MQRATKRFRGFLHPGFVSLLILGASGGATIAMAQSSGTFTATGNMTTARMGHTATLLPNGSVLLAGGAEADTFGIAFSAAALYNPVSRTFNPTDNMTTDRALHTATLLPDGTVLIAAGWGGCCGRPLNGSAEIYDPSSGTFRFAGNMTTPREAHTATILPDGRVLIAGGFTYSEESREYLSTAELYDPTLLLPAPVLFSLSGDGQGQGAVLHAGTHQVASSSNPATVGEALEIYCTGLGDGSSVIPPQVAIGGRMAEVLFFGKAPGFARLNQVNVRVPGAVAPAPAVPVRLTYIGRLSNEVTIGVR